MELSGKEDELLWDTTGREVEKHLHLAIVTGKAIEIVTENVIVVEEAEKERDAGRGRGPDLVVDRIPRSKDHDLDQDQDRIEGLNGSIGMITEVQEEKSMEIDMIKECLRLHRQCMDFIRHQQKLIIRLTVSPFMVMV